MNYIARDVLKVARDLVGGKKEEDYYYKDLLKVLAKINKIGGYNLDADPYMGTISLELGNGDYLYATPFWDGAKGIVYQLDKANGEVGQVAGEIPFKVTFDVKKDSLTYVKKVMGLVRKISKAEKANAGGDADTLREELKSLDGKSFGDVYLSFYEGSGGLNLNGNLTFRRNTSLGAYQDNASKIRQVNNLLSELSKKYNKIPSKVSLFSKAEAQKADDWADNNGENPYSEYEQSLDAGINFKIK